MIHPSNTKDNIHFLILILFFCIIGISEGQNFQGKTFTNSVDFQQREFQTIANFNDSRFNLDANFRFAKFHSTALFKNAKFFSKTNFWRVEFDSVTDFMNTEFYSTAVFRLTKFNSEVKFNKVVFDSFATFREAGFHSTTNYAEAIFHSTADFLEVRFFSNADFRNVVFDSLADFWSAKFNTRADFSGSAFNYRADFVGVTLPDTLLFENVQNLKSIIDFSLAHLAIEKIEKDKNYKCKISIVGSDLQRLKINYELFRLWFPAGTTFELKISTYEQLLKKFQDEGLLESYKMLDVEYQDFKNKQNGNIALNWFLKHWWNYGYNKEWVLHWSFLLFIFFSIINIFTYRFLQNNVYEIKFVFYEKAELQKVYQEMGFTRLLQQRKVFHIIWLAGKVCFYVTAYYIINSLIYTALLFFGIKISTDNFKKFSPLGLYVWLIYLVGLFCVAYIFNIIIVK